MLVHGEEKRTVGVDSMEGEHFQSSENSTVKTWGRQNLALL